MTIPPTGCPGTTGSSWSRQTLARMPVVAHLERTCYPPHPPLVLLNGTVAALRDRVPTATFLGPVLHVPPPPPSAHGPNTPARPSPCAAWGPLPPPHPHRCRSAHCRSRPAQTFCMLAESTPKVGEDRQFPGEVDPGRRAIQSPVYVGRVANGEAPRFGAPCFSPHARPATNRPLITRPKLAEVPLNVLSFGDH